MPDRYFTKQTFTFLSSLAGNNTREWFEEHKQAYENCVREPALRIKRARLDLIPTTPKPA